MTKKLFSQKQILLLFLYFISYCVIGWIYEVVLAFHYGYGYLNRGFLFGPYLPIYGIGALILIYLLYKYKIKKSKTKAEKYTKLWIIFGAIMAITTILELICSYIMEFVVEEWLWDYSNYFMNFQACNYFAF